MGEADLDLEWAGAIAPNATIHYVYAEDNFAAAFDVIDNTSAQVLSTGFGLCELHWASSEVQAFANEAQKAALEGITWLASSGDAGAAGCEDQNGVFTSAITRLSVNLPASLAWVAAVGGTEFNEGSGNYWATTLGFNLSSAISYIPEVAWNDEAYIAQNNLAGFAASGGGASWYFSKPAWQSGLGVPNDGARDVPDVAVTASSIVPGTYLLLGVADANNSVPESNRTGGTALASTGPLTVTP
jgi:subtilase family serine protease